jgi:hypothetical protein
VDDLELDVILTVAALAGRDGVRSAIDVAKQAAYATGQYRTADINRRFFGELS